MDIYCVVCREPWDMDSLHEEAQERYGIPYYLESSAPRYARATKNPKWNSDDYQKVYQEVRREFTANGCPALLSFGARCTPGRESNATASVIYDLMGDDLDGAAAMFEDADALGLL